MRTTFVLLMTVGLALKEVYLAGQVTTQPSVTAIVDVNVVPMDSEVVIQHQTVVIEGNKIVKICAAAKCQLPAFAKIIDGRNKYLIPGLMDMHVHFSKEDLLLFIANGVTTVRNLNGSPDFLDWRDQIKSSKLLGPRIYTSGPLITGPATRWKLKAVPTSVDSAKKLVDDQRKAGYDYIKVYEGLTKELYDAIVDEAKIQNIPVVVHLSELVNLENTLKKGPSSLEHVEKIAYKFDSGFKQDKIPGVVLMIKNSGAWVCPTLASQEIFELNSKGMFLPMLDLPEMAFVDAGTMEWWKSMAGPKREGPLNQHQIERAGFYDFLRALTLELFRAGVPLLAGTDTPNPGMVPGFSIHEELRSLVNAGLSPYDALKTATVNAASYLGMGNQIGIIKEGMVADLVLLEQNPLSDIVNTKMRAGVLVNGVWYPQNDLMALIHKLGPDKPKN